MAAGTRIDWEKGQTAPPMNSAAETLVQRLAQVIERGAQHLLSVQAPEGYWVGQLEADSTLESDYIYYLNVLGKAEPTRIAKLANFVRRSQLPDGGWNNYPGGPSVLNASAKAYFALKLAGDSIAAPHMQLAKARIHELGGLEATNSYVRFGLALVGALNWDMAPALPPELVLFPNWFSFNIYEMSSWSRGFLVPMSILYAMKARWTLPVDVCVDELFVSPNRKAVAFDWDKQLISWRNFFLAIDRAFKIYDRLPWKPLRGRAVRQATAWMMDHMENSEGIAGIFPGFMNSIFVLLALGKTPEDPRLAREITEFSRLEIEEPNEIRIQPCVSPVWDTAIAMVALEESGLPPDHPALVKAASWLLDKQIFNGGDWQVKNHDAEPGGWAFEYRNDWYPDVDDTAFVLLALQRVDFPDSERMQAAIRRGAQWLLSMQNRDGGWGAFDRDNDKRFLTQVPFADHKAMIDPASADVTARVMECLTRLGWPADHPAIQRGEEFLKRDQSADGAWYGRWGVNYIYGTGGVLRALESAGLIARDYARRGVAWLRSKQNPDGGYGESCASYDDPSLKGQGPSTASQTAWALIGLLAAAERNDPCVVRAVEYLLKHQTSEGYWTEDEFTGTGFPGVFYMNYHLYRNMFPVYALSRYRNHLEGRTDHFLSMQLDPAEFRLRSN
jgi:squalene-hopene/tetraprenyl-beta-curcumene cyclase